MRMSQKVDGATGDGCVAILFFHLLSTFVVVLVLLASPTLFYLLPTLPWRCHVAQRAQGGQVRVALQAGRGAQVLEEALHETLRRQAVLLLEPQGAWRSSLRTPHIFCFLMAF